MLTMDVSVNAAGQLEGTVDADAGLPTTFAGTLELLRVLEDLVGTERDGDER